MSVAALRAAELAARGRDQPNRAVSRDEAEAARAMDAAATDAWWRAGIAEATERLA